MSPIEQIALAAAITAFFMVLSSVSLSRGLGELGKCGGIVGPRNVFDDDDDDDEGDS